MTNIIPLILVISTIITGLLWCLNTFLSCYKYQERQEYSIESKNQLDQCSLLRKIRSKLRWTEDFASIFPMLAIILIIRSFVYEPFQIPSGSMMPTLLSGDFILVNKFIYGIKDPIFQKTLIKISHPKRGDIIVFKYPKNSQLNYIKRTVGLPGDKISYDPIEKKVTIQQNCDVSYTICKSMVPVTYSNVNKSDFIQTFVYKNQKEIASKFIKLPKNEIRKHSVRLEQRQETLGNGTHGILTVPVVRDQLWLYYQQPGQKLTTWIVPPKHYFVMGDNRDNSSDSRYWGFVPEHNLVGKATVIWISFEKQENEWPTGLRLYRIGKIC